MKREGKGEEGNRTIGQGKAAGRGEGGVQGDADRKKTHNCNSIDTEGRR